MQRIYLNHLISMFVVALLLVPHLLFASADTEEILRSLPSPEVHYIIPEIRAVKPPINYPTFIKSIPKKQNQENKKPSLTKRSETISKTEKKTTYPLAKIKINQIKKDSVPLSVVYSEKIKEKKAVIKKPEQKKQTTINEVKEKIESNESKNEPENTEKIENNESKNEPENTEKLEGYENKEEPENTEEELENEENEKEIVADGNDSVISTAIELHKKQDWKGIKLLFEENPDAARRQEALILLVEAESNESKPNVMQMRRYGNQIIEKDKTNGWGNYALAYYFYNARKPNATRAAKYLSIALKAKKPPHAAKNLYWISMIKSLMLPIIILIAGIVGGISYIIKKKKKKIDLDISNILEGKEP